MILQRVGGAGDEARPCTQRQDSRIDRGFDRATGRRGRAHTRRRSRGILPLGQPIDGVIRHDQVEVHIPAQRMHQVVAADRQEIPVAADDPDVQARIGHLHARRHGGRAAMDRVEAIGRQVIGKAGGATDAGDEDDVLGPTADIGQHAAHGFQDGVVAAAGAPANFLVRGKIAGGQGIGAHRFGGRDGGVHDVHHRSFRRAASTSATVKGWPVTRFSPLNETSGKWHCRWPRNWPELSSATTMRS